MAGPTSVAISGCNHWVQGSLLQRGLINSVFIGTSLYRSTVDHVDMILKQSVKIKSSRADGAFVGEVSRFKVNLVSLCRKKSFVSKEFKHFMEIVLQTWFMWVTSLLVNTRPQIVHRPPSWFWLTMSCMFEVTRPWAPSKWRSRPWSVKNRHWHFWQLSGGRFASILGWIRTCK